MVCLLGQSQLLLSCAHAELSISLEPLGLHLMSSVVGFKIPVQIGAAYYY
jgi:hypothetical protein